jgi:hypothetical protein
LAGRLLAEDWAQNETTMSSPRRGGKGDWATGVLPVFARSLDSCRCDSAPDSGASADQRRQRIENELGADYWTHIPGSKETYQPPELNEAVRKNEACSVSSVTQRLLERSENTARGASSCQLDGESIELNTMKLPARIGKLRLGQPRIHCVFSCFDGFIERKVG